MRKITFVFFYLAFIISLSAQDTPVFHLDSLPGSKPSDSFTDPSIPIQTSWRYHKGDDLKWKETSFNDSTWPYLNPSLDLKVIPTGTFEGIGWFRLHLLPGNKFINKPLALCISQNGASEIYLNGKLIHKFGEINVKDPGKEERSDPQGVPVSLLFEHEGVQVIAVRYANAEAVNNHRKNIHSVCGFHMRIGDMDKSIFFTYINSNIATAIFIFYFTFFLALSFLHLMFYLFYRTKRSNLYYSIFAGAFGTVFLFITIQKNFMIPDFVLTINFLFGFLPDFYIPALLAMLYSIFYPRFPKVFWLWIILFAADMILNILHKEIPYYGWLLNGIFAVESLRIIIYAIIKKREGAWIIGTGIIATIVFFSIFFVLSMSGNVNFTANDWAGFFLGLLVLYATLSIPVSMTIYLASDFAKTSRNLSRQLKEVETLSAKNIEQEKEKQKILETQKELLEIQVTERTHEIVEQKKVIEEKNKDITDSINYAKRIQEAILPDKELKQRIFPEAFILFKPKDIVSGDFYWFAEKDGKRLIAACDCTGHGVPGALMSMIGNNILNQIVNESGVTSPEIILAKLNIEIRKALKQDGHEATKDGMDIALLCFNNTNELEYAGAHRPLWIIKDGMLTEIKADKHSIGGLQEEKEKSFKKHLFTLSPGTLVYIFTDGYADQFGGDSGKKFMSRQFKELLITNHYLPVNVQERLLDKTIEKWKGSREQIDDILVIGIKI
ncbi:MAG TPA: SpoIIE family protein phosphatase [Bacteroidia bacterium]|jgi:serine phosphatase RsbU (regulator of sigma subunit)